jgi:hypothetical protein
LGLAQSSAPQTSAQRFALSGQVNSTFIVREADLHKPVTIIAYGDTRFTDPSAPPTAVNATARRTLVARIAQERPDAVLLDGDLPLHGGTPSDYAVYRSETKVWRDDHLRIFPVLGNHEFQGCEIPQCLQNWWDAFPQLRTHRWYSVQLGTKLFVIGLDSDDSLLPGSTQQRWLESQISALPAGMQFVFVILHHEPVADIQPGADDNPRPNEMALADLLKSEAPRRGVRFVVVAAHIHNYERFEHDGVVYLVSGGGGAPPQPIERTSSDLYQDNSFPNFHYVKFEFLRDTLNATMYRLGDMTGAVWEAKDSFKIEAKPKLVPGVHKP